MFTMNVLYESQHLHVSTRTCTHTHALHEQHTWVRAHAFMHTNESEENIHGWCSNACHAHNIYQVKAYGAHNNITTFELHQSSEPCFLANLQHYFADFPCLKGSLYQRLLTLETWCGNGYELNDGCGYWISALCTFLRIRNVHDQLPSIFMDQPWNFLDCNDASLCWCIIPSLLH